LVQTRERKEDTMARLLQHKKNETFLALNETGLCFNIEFILILGFHLKNVLEELLRIFEVGTRNINIYRSSANTSLSAQVLVHENVYEYQLCLPGLEDDAQAFRIVLFDRCTHIHTNPA
jgi:hypothetical protein